MDISLNITSAPQPLRSKPQEKTTFAKASKKKNSAASNGFSFEFVGGGKVKAVVARRRNVPSKSAVPEPKEPKAKATEAKAQPKAKQSVALRRKVVATRPLKEPNSNDSAPKADSVPPKRSIAIKRKATDNAPAKTQKVHDEASKPAAKAAPAHDEFILNVFSAPAAQPKPPPQSKYKRNRVSRLDQKRGEGVDGRTLTSKQINAGIRKFQTNPNKKPRVADIYEQKEREQRALLNPAAEGENGQSSPDAADKRSVDPRARKSNAFRVKRDEDSSVKKINLFKNNPEAKVMGQRFVKPIKETIFDGTKVETLGLHAHAVKNLADLLGISELTTVQQKTIPKALEGKDLLVRSQTGSGKTLAYALPVVEMLQAIRPKLTRDAGILAVVIVPTRELAIQTYELFQKLVKPYTWIVPGVLMGGERRKAEKARLRKGINILVGTPGRLVDHLLHTESFKLSQSKFLVLDEADRLLEMGYERDVKQIVEAIDKQRAAETPAPSVHLQRLLLSATLTGAVQKLAGLTLHEPMFIDNSDEDPAKAIAGADGYTKEAIEAAAAELPEDEDDTGILTIPENLQLHYVVVPTKLRLVTLSALFVKELLGKQKLKALVFMSTMEMVNFHHDLLNEQLTQKVLDEDDEGADGDDSDDGDEPLLKGLRFFKLHGSMSQTERQGVFKSFRDSKSGVLLATDVVGRGIDVAEIDLVVQYSPPQKTADFVHRVGRTARAGRSGRAILFLTPTETQFVRSLEEKRIRIAQLDMDVYLQALTDADDEARTIQEAASNLQYKFQELVADDKELHDKACKAFVSWMKFYSTFPRELKPVFNIKNAHMGHFAKSFALKDQPTSFTKKHSVPKAAPPTNRLTYTERDPEKLKQEKRAKKSRFATTVRNEVRTSNRPAPNRLAKLMTTSRALTTSEFDSGMPALKKRKA